MCQTSALSPVLGLQPPGLLFCYQVISVLCFGVKLEAEFFFFLGGGVKEGMGAWGPHLVVLRNYSSPCSKDDPRQCLWDHMQCWHWCQGWNQRWPYARRIPHLPTRQSSKTAFQMMFLVWGSHPAVLRLTPGGARETIWDASNQTQVG